MHIVFLTPEYPTPQKPEGGLGNYIRKVSLELIRRGHKVTVFVLARKQYSSDDQGIRLCFVKRAKFRWRFHQIKTIHPWLILFEQWLNAKHMRRMVLSINKTEKIDILQTSNYKTPGLFLTHVQYFPVVCRCSSYQPLCRSANGARRGFSQTVSEWWETKQVMEADAAFSPSEYIADTYDRFEAIRPSVIRTPVDFAHLKQDIGLYSQNLADKKYLLYFGALNGIKGVDILIHAASEILSKTKDLSFVLIGRNEKLPNGDSAVDQIKNMPGDYYYHKRVFYFPSLTKSQLYPIIQNAQGVVFPSRVDNYPNACLEALSLGVPVVGTYDSSLDEMIEEGKTGFLAKNDDATSLQESIYLLLALTPQQRIEMIQNIHSRIDAIQKEDRTGKLVQFYEEVIEEFLQAK
jgi:glycosyltransferase involved in cell wall biosynthesis